MKTWLLLAALLLARTIQAQEDKRFSAVTFTQKLETAKWMVEYDSAAWRMSELITMATYDELARIGREWFCFKDKDSLWNGVYGKFKDGKYDLVLRYRIAANDTIELVCDPLDTTMLHAISKAINVAYREAGIVLGKSYVRMNKFILYNADKTVSVWLLPALQPNEIAMYGGEFFYQLDASGTKVLERGEYYQGRFKGFKLGKTREVKLEYEDMEAPTQGAVFFALQYRKSFSNIQIVTRESTSLMAFSQVKGYYWSHVEKLKANP